MIIKPIATALTTLVFLSSAIVSSTVAAAEYEAYFEKPQVVSSKTRVEVKQDAVQAQHAGFISTGELGAGYAPIAGRDGNKVVVASKTRAEVIAELRQARNDGTFVANNSEIGVLTASQFAGNARSRADVRAEAIQSAHNGQVSNATSGK